MRVRARVAAAFLTRVTKAGIVPSVQCVHYGKWVSTLRAFAQLQAGLAPFRQQRSAFYGTKTHYMHV